VAKRFQLPVSPGELPSVDVVRKRLGGRAESETGVGEAIRFTTAGGTSHAGVVLFVSGGALEVWTERGVVHRVAREAAEPAGEVAPLVVRVAADAKVFASLGEGQAVEFVTDRGVERGRLAEKCRFGALVERSDGSIVGVGFRRIGPAPGGATH
jgi:hypothetical protein